MSTALARPARAAAKLVAAAAAWAGLAAAQTPSVERLEEFDRWASFLLEDRGLPRFRAMTLEVVDGTAVAFVADRLVGGCRNLYASLVVTIPVPAARSAVVIDDPGAMRVDEHPIRPIRFNLMAREEDVVIVAEITKVLGEGDYAEELRRGNDVRFMLGTERETYYLRFSLRGFAAATERSLALCREAERALGLPRQPRPAGPADRDYFGG